MNPKRKEKTIDELQSELIVAQEEIKQWRKCVVDIIIMLGGQPPQIISFDKVHEFVKAQVEKK